MLVLLACVSGPDFAGGGDRTDVDAQLASSGGGGGGGGGGDDTSTPVDTGGIVDDGCTADDLAFLVEAQDQDGIASQFFSVGDTIEVVASFTNGCADDITVNAPSGCLVDQWYLDGDDGTGMSSSVSCDAGSTTLASGTTVTNSFAVGELGLGAYTATADSGATGLTAVAYFTVQ